MDWTVKNKSKNNTAFSKSYKNWIESWYSIELYVGPLLIYLCNFLNSNINIKSKAIKMGWHVWAGPSSPNKCRAWTLKYCSDFFWAFYASLKKSEFKYGYFTRPEKNLKPIWTGCSLQSFRLFFYVHNNISINFEEIKF
jgi:hypothetical protein